MLFRFPDMSGLKHRLQAIVAMAFVFGEIEWMSIVASGDASHIPTLRPICGIAVALILTRGKRRTGDIIAAVLVGGLVPRTFAFGAVVPALYSMLVLVSAVLAISTLAGRFIGPVIRFRVWREVVGFLAISTAACIPLGGLYAIPMYAMTGRAVFDSWLTWSLCTALSCALFTPVVSIFVQQGWRALLANRARLLICGLASAAVVIGVFFQSHLPLLYMVPLVLTMVAMIGEIEGVVLGVAVTAVIGLVATAWGHGPAMLVSASLPVRLMVVQQFLAALTTVLLPTAAAITERQELRHALIKANAAKSEFLSNMSHEIRTPLNSVIGFADLLAQHGDLGDQARSYAACLQTGGRTLLGIINDILDYSKLESGQIVIRPEPTPFGSLVEDVVGLLCVQASAKGLKMILRGNALSLGHCIEADAQRLRQILLNLIGNAIKFTDQGSVSVCATYRPGASTGQPEILRIEVKDTGPGMAPDDLQRLFGRFVQLETGGQRRGGTGLGLAICKGLVEAMQGTIGATSQPAKGSTFWFEIPAPKGMAAALNDNAPASRDNLKVLGA